MSGSDKRSVATDALETLGTIIDDNQGRDAIHLAVIPVMAAHDLNPGQDVGMIGELAGVCDNPVGIVDPFIKGSVMQGQYFWLVIYPRQITSLRHVWSHPAFPEETEQDKTLKNDKKALLNIKKESAKREAEEWLRSFCSSADCPGYEDTISAAQHCGDDEYLHFNDQDAHGDIPDEFWDKLEIMTGKKFANRPKYFSCSC